MQVAERKIGSTPRQLTVARGGGPSDLIMIQPSEVEGEGQDEASQSSPLRLFLGESRILVSCCMWDSETAQGGCTTDSDLRHMN